MIQVSKRFGFTLIELLVIVAILGILLIITISTLASKRTKADDAKIKSDLSRLSIAFEEYYNDHNCYPPPEFFDDVSDCNSSNLSPYLSSLPCDRRTGLPYILEKDDTGCNWYKLYATLQNANDPASVALHSEAGSPLGNYGVSSTNVTISVLPPTPTPASSPVSLPSPSEVATPTPTPAPSVINNYFYCQSVGNCTSYDPNLYSCTPSYTNEPNCDRQGCLTISSCSSR